MTTRPLDTAPFGNTALPRRSLAVAQDPPKGPRMSPEAGFRNTEPTARQVTELLQRWAAFRVTHPPKVLGLLRDLCSSSVPLFLGPLPGGTCSAWIWSVDVNSTLLHVGLECDPSQLEIVRGAQAVWAAAYLGEHKIQFLLVVRRVEVGPRHTVLPTELYRLPRRASLRVRRLGSGSVRARVKLPEWPGEHQLVEVLDISEQGCALHWPLTAMPLASGQVIEGVEFMLDEDAYFFADLEVRHVRERAAEPGAFSLGCRFVLIADQAVQTLVAWMRGGRRQGLLTLDLS
jgi:c-di-GMP-binding flagellar brake protein YcgR